MERVQNYGFTSHPHPGGATETLALFVGGDRGNGLVIVAGDRRYRLRPLVEGEVALYDDLGQVVHLKRTGIHIVTPLDIRMEGENVRIHARSSLHVDCGGNGWVHTPGHRDDYVIGSTSAAHPLAPPEVP